MHRPLAPALARFARGALVVLLIAACSKKEDSAPTDAGPPPVELFGVRVRDTPLELRIPKGWSVDDVPAAPLPAKPKPPKDGEVPKVALTGRLMFGLRAPDGAYGLVPPRVQLFHDPWLPVGTTASDYLGAQREANEAVVKAGTPDASTTIRHVEAERSRRDGRPSYYVRDEWDLKVGDRRETVSQVSLLLIDTDADGELHGYTLVATMTKGDRARLDAAVREMMDSAHFAKE